MDFNGSSDKIEVQDASNEFGFSNNSFSLSAWVFIDSVSTQNGLIAKRNIGGNASNKMWYFEINTSSQLRFLWYTSSSSINASSTDTIPLNTWTHVVVTSNGAGANGLTFYINGTADSGGAKTSPSSASSIQQTGTPFWIGARGGNSSAQYTNGKIDQVSVFDYELSASQVSTLYGGGTAITNPMSLSPKPIAYYQLGDQSVDNGANYLVPNNSLSDYVFNFTPNDHITIANSTDFNFGTGDFTISFWVNFDNFTPFQYPFDFRDSNLTSENVLSMYIKPTTNRIVLTGGGVVALSGDSGTVLTTGVWNNIIVKRTNTQVTSHINGATADQTSGVYVLDFNTTPKLNIGARGDGAAGINGKMSNFQVFNTALPQTGSNSIETIYNNGSPLTSMSGFTSLQAWYKLNAADTFNSSTSTWTINDYAGSNDGTSSGMDSSNLVVSDLQQTSGYSPYALDLDGVDDYLDCGDSDDFSFGNGVTDSPFSVSAWINMTDATRFRVVNKGIDFLNNHEYVFTTSGSDLLQFSLYDSSTGARIARRYNTSLTSFEGQWIHLVASYDGSETSNGIKIYFNGSILATDSNDLNPENYTAMENGTKPLLIGASLQTGGAKFSNGKFSNVSVFNIELSSTQVTEIYNSGIPSDLNTFSGTAPVSWWQIGSNSSFNTNWTCLDEIGTNNAVSVNMTNDAITDGVGYSASGLGTSSIDIKGDAPYSTANGLSNSMDVLNRKTDIPS